MQQRHSYRCIDISLFSLKKTQRTSCTPKLICGCVLRLFIFTVILTAVVQYFRMNKQFWNYRKISRIFSFVDKVDAGETSHSPIEFWRNTANMVDCVQTWSRTARIHPGSIRFQDWDYHYNKSGCPVYPIPKEGVIFHMLRIGAWRPFLCVTIDAFLATQNLKAGHRIFFWYTEEVPQDIYNRYALFPKHLEFRYLNATKEAEGTCMEHMREFSDAKYAAALSLPITTRSDLIRQLLMSKYGGGWIDTDAIPMRNLEPMLRTGPFAQSLGKADWNNHLLYYGPKEAGIAEKMMNIACQMPYNKTEFYIKYKERPIQWDWLYNDGLHKIAVNQGVGITQFPVCYTDGRFWTLANQKPLHPCDENEMRRLPVAIPMQLRQLFTWHARLNQFEDSCIFFRKDQGGQPQNITVAHLVWSRAQTLIERGTIGFGQPLFSGPSTLEHIDEMN